MDHMFHLFMQGSNMRNKIFSLILIILLILGIGIFIKPQNSISKNEKRYLASAEDIDSIDDMQNVLSDQFYLRENITNNYFKFKLDLNNVPYELLSLLGKNNEYQYLASDVILIKDGNYLMNDILYYDEAKKESVMSKAYNINQVDLKYENIKTYVYFPTSYEETIDYEDNYGTKYRELFLEQLNQNITTSQLEVFDLKTYQEYYYKSDFHWAAKGAYQGYKDIINMINKDFDIGSPKEIEEEINYDYKWIGNIGSKIGGNGAKDTISDYNLKDIGEYDYYIDGEISEYGAIKKDYALNGNQTGYSDYDVYFGNNLLERRFEFNDKSKPNLLVFCDSMTNVTQEWLASHFNTTVYIDLRANDGLFNLDEYIDKYDIDIILFTQYYENLYFNGYMYVPLD